MHQISVVIPAYNRAHTIKRAIESALKQTLSPCEIIVVDDNSTDATRDSVKDYSNVILLSTEKNLGPAGARNLGVEHAKGDLIAFLDSDDEWSENKLELQSNYLIHNSEVDLLCCGLTLQNVNGSLAKYNFKIQREVGDWTFNDFTLYPFSPSTWLIKKTCLKKAGLFDSGLMNCEDLDLLAKLNKQCKIALIPELLVFKYNQADGIDSNLSKRTRSLEIIFQRHRELWLASTDAAYFTLLKLASMHFNANQPVWGRRSLYKALTFKPFNIGLLLRILISYLPGNAFRLARKIKNR